MGSSLIPALANIFVVFHERGLRSIPKSQLFISVMMTINFVFLMMLLKRTCSLTTLIISIQPLNTVYTATDYTLPFLDALVRRTILRYVMSINWKLTFMGLYTRGNLLFAPSNKNNLFKTLTKNHSMICSKSTLDSVIKFIPDNLCNNGFPLRVLQTVITNKITEINKIKQESVQKYSMYLRLPWLGGISERFAKQISQNVQRCYFSFNVRVVFHTKIILTFIHKDVISHRIFLNLIYLFKCSCGSNYIGKPNQRLLVRIKHHVSTKNVILLLSDW